MLSTGFVPAIAQLLGKGLDHQGWSCHSSTKSTENGTLFPQHLLVKPDAGPRVMRCKADCNGTLDAISGHLLQSVGDEGMPVAHADVNRDAQLARYSIRLLTSDAGERRAAD